MRICLAFALVGCVSADGTTTTPTPALPLAQLDAKLSLDEDLVLSITSDGCNELEVNVEGLLDGVLGQAHRGTGWTMTCDSGDCTTTCDTPTFTWHAPQLGDTTTIKVTDLVTTWTIVIDQLHAPHSFVLDTPTAIHGGDVVKMHMTPGGVMDQPSVVASTDGHTLFQIDENGGLTHTATDLQFTMPPISATASANLYVSALALVWPTTCDAPRGCAVSPAVADANVPVTLAP